MSHDDLRKVCYRTMVALRPELMPIRSPGWLSRELKDWWEALGYLRNEQLPIWMGLYWLTWATLRRQ